MRVIAATAAEKTAAISTTAICVTLSSVCTSDTKERIVAAVVRRFVDINQLILAKHTPTLAGNAVATRSVSISVRPVVAAHAHIFLCVIV